MKSILVVALVVVAVAVAGCTTDTAEPPPTTQITQRSHTERPKVAPAITRELDLSHVGQPCDLLHADQRRGLGFPTDGPRGYSDSCQWHTPDADLGLVLHTGFNALQNAYDSLQGVSYNVFRPTTIAGQPAVVYTTFADARACYITVGIAHDQGFYLIASGGRPSTDWCAMVVTAATDIVHNLGG